MKRVLLDTNVLLLWVVGNTDERYIAQHKRTGAYSIQDFDALSSFLAQAQTVETTTHVLTETSNLLAQSHHELTQDLFRTYTAVLNLVDEQQPKANVLSQSDSFARLGLADTSLLHQASLGTVLLTSDAELHTTACALNFPCVHFNELRETL